MSHSFTHLSVGLLALTGLMAASEASAVCGPLGAETYFTTVGDWDEAYATSADPFDQLSLKYEFEVPKSPDPTWDDILEASQHGCAVWLHYVYKWELSAGIPGDPKSSVAADMEVKRRDQSANTTVLHSVTLNDSVNSGFLVSDSGEVWLRVYPADLANLDALRVVVDASVEVILNGGGGTAQFWIEEPQVVGSPRLVWEPWL